MAAPQPVPAIPDPILRHAHNFTGYHLCTFDKMGPGRTFHDVIVLKGVFELVPGELVPSQRKARIAYADEVWDASCAERSSLRRAGDAVLCKPGTDILVTGAARAPRGQPAKRWDALVRVSDANGKVLCQSDAEITGPRAWVKLLGGWTLTEPQAATSVPVRYELAYGGAYPDPDHRPASGERRRYRTHAANPSGLGFVDEGALESGRAYPAPQWQKATRPVTQLNSDGPLVGFGPIARPWASRYRFAGTYDAGWREQALADADRGLCIDYSRDFDPRFFQAAHPELIVPTHLTGGEQLGLVGLVEGHDVLVTRLPAEQIVAWGLDRRLRERVLRPALDTVHVDLDAGTVELVWRLTLDREWGMRSLVLSRGDRRP
jgi:hypothetical protein